MAFFGSFKSEVIPSKYVTKLEKLLEDLKLEDVSYKESIGGRGGSSWSATVGDIHYAAFSGHYGSSRDVYYKGQNLKLSKDEAEKIGKIIYAPKRAKENEESRQNKINRNEILKELLYKEA